MVCVDIHPFVPAFFGFKGLLNPPTHPHPAWSSRTCMYIHIRTSPALFLLLMLLLLPLLVCSWQAASGVSLESSTVRFPVITALTSRQHCL